MKWLVACALVLLLVAGAALWTPEREGPVVTNLLDVLESVEEQPQLRTSSFWTTQETLNTGQWRLSLAICHDLDTPNCRVVKDVARGTR